MIIKQRIMTFMESRPNNDWLIKGDIVDNKVVKGKNYAETVGRKLRELVADGELETKKINGYAHYRSAQ